MIELKSRWNAASGAIKGVCIVVAIAVAALLLWKVMPWLFAAAGIGTIIAILFIPYWIPTIVAFWRKHPSKAGIEALNFFLGWTFIGWVLALVWAFSDNTGRAPAQTVVNTTVAPSGAPGSASGGLADELNKLAVLHEAGALSDEEFGRAKVNLLE
jgi:hypothetical protein